MWLTPTLATGGPGTSLPPPTGAPAVRPPRMPGDPTPAPAAARSSRTWWLVAGLGATLLLASLAGLASWGSVTGGLWGSVEQNHVYPAGISTITFEGGSGDVEIRADATSDEVRVTRKHNWGPGSAQPTPDEQVQGDTLRISENCSGFLSWCSIDYVMHVPMSTSIQLQNGSGDVVLSGSLGTTSASTGSGDLLVDGNGSDDLRLEAGSGDIATSGLTAKRVVGHTGSGSMDLEFAAAPDDVALDAGSGDVSVRLPQGTYAVTAETGSGDTEVGVATNPGAQDRLVVKTGSGDINVTYR